MPIKYITIICLLISNLEFTLSQDYTVYDYIKDYKDIAIREMNRSGVPASITLAQGIHESRFGTSELATESNNHFGIKCGSKWTGPIHKKWDDEAKKSCFRKYQSAEESYIDHSDFLSKRSRYAFLFDYEITDYKNWAKGLKKAGYATDPKYPSKLIKTIEKYNLSRFDTPQNIEITDKQTIDNIYIQVNEQERKRRPKVSSSLFTSYKTGAHQTNGISYLICREGETALEFSKRMGIPYAKVLKFNDLIDGDKLIDYQHVFIQPKRRRYRGKKAIHIVSNNETLYEIAQFYGVRLKTILKLNQLNSGEEVANGQGLYLKTLNPQRPILRDKNIPIQTTLPNKTSTKDSIIVRMKTKPKTNKPVVELKLNKPIYHYNNPDTDSLKENNLHLIPEDSTWMDEIEPNISENTNNSNNSTSTNNTISNNELFQPPPHTRIEKTSPELIEIPSPTPIVEQRIYHVVKKGETLFSLQREYGVPYKEIMKINNLQSTVLSLNQRIIIK